MLQRLLIAFWAALLTSVPLFAQTPQKPPIDGYVPITGPPPETVPAAPLLIGAYIIVWLGLMIYVWSIWRRLAKVETEMQALQRRTSGSAR
jgi:CcmD family protein